MTYLTPLIMAAVPVVKSPSANPTMQRLIENAGNKIFTMVAIFGAVEIGVLLFVLSFAFRLWPRLRRSRKLVIEVAGAVGGVLGVYLGWCYIGLK